MEDLEGIEDWLYEDGEEGGANAPVDAYKQKRKKMDDRVNAIFFRLAELEARPKAIEAARAILEAAKAKVEEWKTARPQVTEEDIKSTTLMVDEIAKWLEEKEKKQAELDTTADPAFSSLDVKKQIRPLSRLVSRLLSKKLPKPAVPNATEVNATETEEKPEENTDSDEAEKASEEKNDGEEQSTEL
jgi:hypoxia up-regulated 1